MKQVKVLMYKDPFKGTLKSPSREIIPLVGDSIYYIAAEEEWGQELVFHIDGLYFSMGHFSLTNFKNDPSHRAKAIAVHQSFQQYVEEMARPTLLHIEVFKTRGWEYDLLIQRREKYNKTKAEEAERKAMEKAADAEKQEAANRARILENVNILKSGGNITFTELEEIAVLMGLKLHPRTIGAMRRIDNRTSDGKINMTSGTFHKSIQRATIDTMFNVVAKIIEL